MEQPLSNDASKDAPHLHSVADLPGAGTVDQDAQGEAGPVAPPKLSVVPTEATAVPETEPEQVDHFAHLQNFEQEPVKAPSVIDAERAGENPSGFDAVNVFAVTPVEDPAQTDDDQAELVANVTPEVDASSGEPVAEVFDPNAFRDDQTAAFPAATPVANASTEAAASTSSARSNEDELRSLVPKTGPSQAGLPWHRQAVYVIGIVVIAAVVLRFLGIIGG